MSEVALALQALREQLSDTQLYTDANKQVLADLLKREGELKIQAAQLDDLWLEQQQELEELTQ